MISLKVLKFNAIWCSACLVMKKTYNRIFDEYKEFEVITYDYDIDEDMVTKYNIGTTIPVLIFLNNVFYLGVLFLSLGLIRYRILFLRFALLNFYL